MCSACRLTWSNPPLGFERDHRQDRNVNCWGIRASSEGWYLSKFSRSSWSHTRFHLLGVIIQYSFQLAWTREHLTNNCPFSRGGWICSIFCLPEGNHHILASGWLIACTAGHSPPLFFGLFSYHRLLIYFNGADLLCHHGWGTWTCSRLTSWASPANAFLFDDCRTRSLPGQKHVVSH